MSALVSIMQKTPIPTYLDKSKGEVVSCLPPWALVKRHPPVINHSGEGAVVCILMIDCICLTWGKDENYRCMTVSVSFDHLIPFEKTGIKKQSDNNKNTSRLFFFVMIKKGWVKLQGKTVRCRITRQFLKPGLKCSQATSWILMHIYLRYYGSSAWCEQKGQKTHIEA